MDDRPTRDRRPRVADGGSPSIRGLRYHVVDVFARDGERFTGNQLAVFHDAADVDAEEALALTRETNFSECTFVGDETDDGRAVRIFDPAEEIPFAGHPTLGTAAVQRELIGDDESDRLTLNLGVGPIDVWVEERTADGDGVDGDEVGDGTDGNDETPDDGQSGHEEYWMRQVPPEFGETVPADVIAPVLGLDTADVDESVPVQAVSTGLPTLVVPLASVDAVGRAATTEPEYAEFIDAFGEHNVLVVARGGVDGGDLHARVFADYAGVPEDPATGSAAGCLAGWLLEHRFLGDGPVSATVEQGYEMGRPSRLRLRAERDAAGDPVVEVGGAVVPVAEGRVL
ncbi:PhzF family phenazine biosynthesis protein [Halobaculum sp. CBA1158]|uniref:PhzF family phenazine biosynthesis protein n=1 Tax=Halobaculum sp. CBA1158 TaxID=2904243 RepID=UPI001F266E4F|nr:PhzF family phenazine biosynthesis protein [Halobaculum sp. CBA1158]UIO98863.1 PhzF family phenazine biosynthesis protein [Halobaculum sp. CBA1158]